MGKRGRAAAADAAEVAGLKPRLDAVGSCPRAALTVVADAIRRRYDDAFEAIGMSSAQFTLLSAIGWLGETTPTGLTALVARDQTTLSRGVAGLRRRGWVLATRDAEDRRVQHLRLTEEGLRQLTLAMDRWEQVRGEIAAAIGEEELERLVTTAWSVTRALR